MDSGTAFTGGAGNDTFAADIATLNAGDSINGGAGTDTLNFTGTTNVALPVASIEGVEVFNIRQTTLALASTDLSLYGGLTTVNYDRSNQAGQFTNLAEDGTFGVVGNASVINTGALQLGYVTAATAAVINFSGGTLGAQAVSLTGTGLTSTTINSAGAANVTGAFVDANTSKALTINATTGLTTGTIGDSGARTAITINATGAVVTGAVTSSAATTVAITGAGAVTTGLSAVVAPTITVSGSGAVALGTLNALAATVTSTQTAGSLTLTAGTLVTAVITGGAGNDVFTTGAVLTTGSMNGGAGTDTLIIGTNVAHVNTTSLAAKYTNFETLSFAGILDVSGIAGITALQLSGASTVTGLSAAQAASVQASAGIGTSSFALTTATGTSDVLTLTMGTGTTTAAATNSGVVTVTGFETVNIIANAGPTATTAAALLTTIDGFGTPTTLSTVNLTGSAVAITDAATTVATTFNASALTGNSNATIGTAAADIKGLTLGGNLASGSTVTGSNFIDTITIGATGAAGSTYNLGAGADAISTTFANLRTGAVYNNIDGGAGTDTVTITGGGALTMVDADFKGLTNIERIVVETTAGNAQSITTGGFFDTNFKAVGSTLTTTSTGGAIVIDQSTFSGTNAVTATATTGAITISGGSGNQTISATNIGTGAITITTLGGNDTVTVVVGAANIINTGAGNDTIVGGIAVDTITGGAGADTINGGGGQDVYIFAAGDSNTTSTDVITGYLTTQVIDHSTLTITANSTAVVAASGTAGLAGGGAVATFNTADNTLALRIVAIEAAVASATHAAGEAAHFQFGLDTYVFITDGVAGVGVNDTFIKLVGVDSATLTFDTLTLAGGNLNLA